MMNFIRISVVLFAFVTYITADHIDNAIEILKDVKNIQTCANVDLDAIPQYITQQYSNFKHGDGKMIEEFACLLGCTAKETHLLDDTNTFDKDKVESIMTSLFAIAKSYRIPTLVTSPIKDAVLSCFATPTSYADPCTAARVATECVISNIMNLYSEVTGKK